MRVVDELRVLYRNAKARAVTFRDAVKGQAEKHGVEPVALRRYVVALESDTVERIQAELDDLLKLLDDDAE